MSEQSNVGGEVAAAIDLAVEAHEQHWARATLPTVERDEAALRDRLWAHAEACITGSGCIHDDTAACADSLLANATTLHRAASEPTAPAASGAGA